LILIVAAGLTALRKPFAGDQSLFVVGAKAMSHGAVLYRDFWDIKQPGIYWFYQLGLKIPASPEVAVHVLEMLYFVALAVVMMAALRSYFHDASFAALAAFFTCGVYFIITGSAQLTQVEGLVQFPLFVCAWALLAPIQRHRLPMSRVILAGLAAGVVVLLKLMLVVLPVGFFVMLIISERVRRRSLLECLLAIVLFAAGLALVTAPVLMYYQSIGQIDLLYATWIQDPMRINSELPHNSILVLKGGMIWFAIRTMGLLPLACIGAVVRRHSWLTAGLLFWLFTGFAMIALQRKGWDYHFLMLLCPMAILAAAGAEYLIETTFSGRLEWLAFVPAIVLAAYVAVGAANGARQLHDPRPDFYARAVPDDAVLTTADAKPGPIYVLGTPLIYYLTDRPQAVPLNGWSPEMFLSEQWMELGVSIRQKRPPFIFISAENRDLLPNRGQQLQDAINSNYTLLSHSLPGDWYALKPTPQ
jgi:hypothetical protein